MNDISVACQYFLNHDLREEELRRHVAMMAAAGYECIHAHSRDGGLTPYLSEAWFHAVAVILDECRKHGVKFAIWDEDGFPSPIAGGRITATHPEFASQKLTAEIFDAPGGVPFRKILSGTDFVLGCYAVYPSGEIRDITGYCGTVSVAWKEPYVNFGAYTQILKMGAPHQRRECGKKQWAVDFAPDGACRIVTVRVSRECGCHTVDLLNADAVKMFLDITHEAYFRRFGKDFGDLIVSSFFDEPSVGCEFPWTGTFAENYEKRWHEDLLKLLPHLFMDIDESSPQVRHRYRMVQHDMLCGNYLDPVRTWCHRHGIISAGHLSRTENLSYCNGYLWPDELRCCKYSDIPCTDPLGFNIAWRDTASYATGIKVVSSAAKLFGKKHAGSDALGVMGNEAGLRDLRSHLDFQLALGITWFNVHGLCYSIDGFRKDEAPPSLFYQHSEWELMGHLIRRTRDLCARLSAAPSECRVSMLYPSASFYCRVNHAPDPLETELHLLADDLLSHHTDFDFIDEVSLAELAPEELAERYPYFIVPPIRFITGEALSCLQKYPGRLLTSGDAPRVVGGGTWDGFRNMSREELLSALPGERIAGPNDGDVFCRRLVDGTVFLFNRNEREFRGFFGDVPIKLPPMGGELLETATASAAEEAELKTVMELSGDWHFSIEENHVPLAFCCCEEPSGRRHYFDLLRREVPDAEKGGGKYSFSFHHCGEANRVRLVIEEDTERKMTACRVNGHEVSGFVRETVFDCRNFVADVTEFIRTGSNPAVNVIEFDASEPITEMPRLYGKFTVEFHHCSNAVPYLYGNSLDFEAKLQDLRSLGLGSFSGKAELRYSLDCGPGWMYISLGRVEDAARVFWDGREIAVVMQAPYSVDLGEVAQGPHTLTVEVFNAPANREHLAGLPAGLLGPVALKKRVPGAADVTGKGISS